MTEEGVPIASESTWWCTKIFECVKNRNRIGPGKIELPDCDFFIVGPRRTLRVLVPTPRGSVYYETTRNERPETIDENFVSRWASRPHPSGNCRCSFRQSKSRYSTNEERMISDEINRIRTSLCEAEKSGEDIDKLEQRISLNLDVLTTDCAPIVTREPSRNDLDDKMIDATTELPTVGNDNEKAMKNKIVKDLESYIERLLHEVLSDTMKFFNDAGDTLRKSHEVLKKSRKCSCGSVCLEAKHLETCPTTEIVISGVREEINIEESTIDSVDKSLSTVDNEDFAIVAPTNSFDINFAFHREEEFDDTTKDDVKDIIAERGHVNRGFDGTTMDPDSLDFHLAKTSSNEIENLDCTDSGINSVETMEFQTLQEPSLEESLMEIIDAKFGRSTTNTTKTSWNEETEEPTPSRDNETTNNPQKVLEEIDRCVEDVETMKNTSSIIERIQESKDTNARTSDESTISRGDDENGMELEETTVDPNFDKLRLELLQTSNSTKKPNAIVALREKLTRKLASGCKSRDEKRENSEKTKNARTKNEPIASSPPIEFAKMERRVWQDISEAPYRRDVRVDAHTDVVKFRKFRKPTIVFLHGFGSSAEIFENQLEYFSNLGYPCIAPEILGHGMSSAPDRSRDYHFDKLLKDLEIILQHYAFTPGNKCVLVAHNYGCSFATALACKYDSNIHQLVLISGGGPTPLAAPSTEGAGHCCLRAMLTPLLMCGLHRDILYSARGRQHPYCGPEPVEQWPSHMKYVLDGMVWPEGDYVFHRRICTPTLLIHGLRDDKVSLVQECQMERTIIKAFLDAIPTAGHTPMTDCPEQVNHMIHCFIDLWRRKKR